MTADPGVQRVEISAEAITYTGWDAAATDGELVATKLYAAQYAGAVRGSWPVSVDVVEGSTVSVTAWVLQPAQTTGAPGATGRRPSGHRLWDGCGEGEAPRSRIATS